MSKAQGLHRYLRTISRKLVCYKDTKQTLLEGLEQELSVYSSLSYDELCQEIGNPTQVSAQLMENISEQEIAYMKRRRKMILCTVSICFVIAFLLLCSILCTRNLLCVAISMYKNIIQLNLILLYLVEP